MQSNNGFMKNVEIKKKFFRKNNDIKNNDININYE